MRITILILVSLCSCAPPPGDQLAQGIKQPANIESVQIAETIGFLETQEFCHRSFIDNGRLDLSIAACILNACIIPACYQIRYDIDSGRVIEAQVYLAWDIQSLREHEMRHVMGYDDRWY